VAEEEASIEAAFTSDVLRRLDRAGVLRDAGDGSVL
jgi:hypothetical protein